MSPAGDKPRSPGQPRPRPRRLRPRDRSGRSSTRRPSATSPWSTTAASRSSIPTLHARDGSTLFLHGSSASRLFRTRRQQGGLRQRDDASTASCSPDRSSTTRSTTARSSLFGAPGADRGRGRQERGAAGVHREADPGPLGRRPAARPAGAEGHRRSCGCRSTRPRRRSAPAAPVDEPEDYELPVWAGTVPLRTVAGEPIPDDRLARRRRRARLRRRVPARPLVAASGPALGWPHDREAGLRRRPLAGRRPLTGLLRRHARAPPRLRSPTTSSGSATPASASGSRRRWAWSSPRSATPIRRCTSTTSRPARAELEEKGVEFLGDTFDTGVCHMALFQRPGRQRPDAAPPLRGLTRARCGSGCAHALAAKALG